MITAVAEQPSDDWIWVRYLASAHPYSTVRTAAWSALMSSAPDQAIAEFIATGYDYAVSRAQERRIRNLDRLHSTLNYRTPHETRMSYRQDNALAA